MTAPRASGFAFAVEAQDGDARASVFTTPHGPIELPTFMPVGTQGSVKTLAPEEVAATGARVVLGNTYHLWLRPGADAIASFGGLHAFTRWPHAMLTDSGGFQAFSLSKLTELAEDGFTFRSHLDGSSATCRRRRPSASRASSAPTSRCSSTSARRRVATPRGGGRRPSHHALGEESAATPRPDGQALFGIVQGACFPISAARTPRSSPRSIRASTGSRSAASPWASPSSACTPPSRRSRITSTASARVT